MKKLVLLLTLVTSAVAFGGVININLVSSTLTGSSGSLLTFSGALVNTTSTTQNLNNANIGALPAAFASGEDVTPFYNNAPLFLTANQTTASLALFSVTIPAGVAQGLYAGSFTIFGGPTVNDQTVLGSAAFNVQVVPEPATWALMFTALAVFAL